MKTVNRFITTALVSMTLLTASYAEVSVAPAIDIEVAEATANGNMLLAQRSKKKRVRRSRQARKSNQLTAALKLVKAGQYEKASQKLFQLSFSPRYTSKRMQIKYILGLMLYKMKLYQTAAFQFIGVIKQGRSKYVRPALEKLSLAADHLGDDTLLNYAISKIRINSFPKAHRDKLLYRIGEYQMRNKQWSQASESFRRVRSSSPLYNQAKYMQGLSLAKVNKTKSALAAFEQLEEDRSDGGVVDKARVAALMGKARVLYQMKAWDRSIAAYKEVPRDSLEWHATLFESSWAMLRSGKFRSALSNFQSLHSAFYEDFYLPESLLLRAIVYVYICRYDEMEKVLDIFNRTYTPMYKSLTSVMKSRAKPATHFNDVVKIMREYKLKGDDMDRSVSRIPFPIARRVYKEGDFQTSYQYIVKLIQEKKRIAKLGTGWGSSALGKYSKKIIKTRLAKARSRAGRQVRAHVETLRSELFDLIEQEGFIRFEMTNSKKENLKKKIAGQDLSEIQIDEDNDRDYYIQNGYEYWPFDGESWLDELGNYHYLGTQACQ